MQGYIFDLYLQCQQKQRTMETKEFKKLEIKVMDEVNRIQGATKAYYEEGWLKEEMYWQIFMEAVEEIKFHVEQYKINK